MNNITKTTKEAVEKFLYTDPMRYKLASVGLDNHEGMQKITRLIAGFIDSTVEIIEARDLVMDLFRQACWVTPPSSDRAGYDHQFMGTYEEAQRYLLEVGMITPEECLRK